MKKKLFVSMFVLALGGSIWSQSISLEGIENQTIDFGTLSQEDSGEKTVVIKNSGDKPLLISNIKGSCSCTVTEFSKTPIPPGKTATFKVQYNTKIKGRINKVVTITSNDVEHPTLSVRIVGMVQ